jgi:hypothetical protein
MTSPEARLADARWRIRNSIYLLAALSFGFVFAGFLYTGILARRRVWIIWGVVYGVACALGIALIQIAGGSAEELSGGRATMSRIGALLYLAQWIGGGIHLSLQRRHWLRWKASCDDEPWYAAAAPASVGTDAADITQLGMRAPARDYLAPRTATTQIDLNTAPSDDIARLPGVGVATATRLVSERDQRGGFESLAEAMEAARLDPAAAERLVGAVFVSRPVRQAPTGGTGRVVDL